ncbi:E1 ubiquitin-activating protein uba2 [Mitosporidium daphniae]
MKILLLGAGGIGCELLKVFSSLPLLESIDLVDMDTIEVTNLHRQFLFRKEHIGQPKATVAAMIMESFSPSLRGLIKPWVANVFSLPLTLFSSMTIVINALDNIEARSRISLMCLLAGKMLIDVGTAGIEGQVTTLCGDRKIQPIECFNCVPKSIPSSDAPIPVCTIRQTPTTFTHCVIWAKEILFNSLFCTIYMPPESKHVDQDGSEGESGHLPRNGELMAEAKNSGAKKDDSSSGDDLESYLARYVHSPSSLKDLLLRIFHTDIVALVAMESLWSNRLPPSPLALQSFERSNFPFSAISEYAEEIPIDDLLGIMCFYIEKLISIRPLAFDKDDHDSIALIHAAACIRAHVFGISMQSRFSVRAITGRIVPAVISTNAVAAGLATLQLIHMMNSGYISGGSERSTALLPTVYYAPWRKGPGSLFLCERIQPPNPECEVCGIGLFILNVGSAISTKLATVISLIEEHLYPEETFTILAGSRTIYDPDFQSLTEKTLDELSLKAGALLFLIPEEEKLSKARIYLNCVIDQPDDVFQPYIATVLALSSSNKRRRCWEEDEKAVDSEDDGFEII